MEATVRRALVAAVLVAFALPPPSARSATIHVPADQPTIRDGLSAAASGDTVLVACGTYFEQDIELVSGVVLRGETGSADCVVIDAARNGRVLLGEGLPVGTAVEGITLTGGFNDEGLDFERSRPPPDGGPHRREAAAPSARDYGGGAGAFLILSNVAFRECAFVGNEAKVHGGGVRCEGGSPTFEGCEFAGNLAGNQGGGLYLGRETSAVLDGCAFTDNHARHGGAMKVARADGASMTACVFETNLADGGGGALEVSFCDIVLTDCVLWGNSASVRGGALALFGSHASLEGCTIVANQAPVASGVLAHTSQVNAANTILAFQTPGEPVECITGTTQLSCCDVHGNAAGDYTGCLAGQEGVAGNFSLDPLFCSWLDGVLTLLSWSPCLPPNNSCGVQIGALGEGPCPGVVPALLDTSPAGLRVSLDGIELTAPATVSWIPGTSHLLGTTTPQSGAPGERFDFEAWSDGGAIEHTVIAPDSASSFEATFSTSYFLTMVPATGGTVTPSSGWYAEGAPVTIEAVPDAGWTFVSWTGTGAGSYTGPDSVATVTMSGPVTQEAHFEQIFHTLTMVADPGGSVTPPTGDYPEGAVVPITAHPDVNRIFTGWTGLGAGSYTGTDNPAQVVILGPITQTAHFDFPPTFPLVMVAGPGGSVSPASGDYPSGDPVQITATPDSGFVFVGWTGSGPGSYTGASNPATITMLGPITETAAFQEASGFEFSISASDTDPFVNTDVPAGGPRSLHLWLTCAEVGIAAFEGDVSGDLPVLAFTPAPNVLNAGHATSLLLAISGCPGVDSPFRVGSWLVTDPGGELCLAPSAANGVLGAVDCDVFALVDPVEVTGFSSAGTAPCFVPGNGCPEPVTSTVTITTEPPGKRIGVDGVDYVSPQTFVWLSGTQHAVDVDSLITGPPGDRERFTQWDDGVATVARTITAEADSVTYSAAFAREYFLDFQDPPEGHSLPGDGWHAVGAPVQIQAVPEPGFAFVEWVGQGMGSYSGPDNPATVTMGGPVVERPVFGPYGYEFSISASPTDPLVNTDAPAGGDRNLYLWLACSDVGISAFEGDVSGDLAVAAFTPSPSVLNAGTPTSLLLAIGGCPGADSPFLVGSWLVSDTGGELCLAPSAANGILGAVDCDVFAVVDPVQVTGFSSGAAPPCFVPGIGCALPRPGPLDPGEAAGSGADLAAAPSPAPTPDALHGGRPNPFGDVTEIRFSVAAPSRVSLAVYDVRGRLVHRLLERQMPAGEHGLRWDGSGRDGRRVPAGVYLFRFQAGTFAQTRKIVVLGPVR